jgi:hypothetical protein
MSRTYRRRSEQHEYGWVLCDYRCVNGARVKMQSYLYCTTAGADLLEWG